MAELTGGTWEADSLSSPDHGLVMGSKIALTFTDDTISVNAGCNTMNGAASIDGGKLVVDTLASTLMGCDEALAQQDTWLQGFLTSRPLISLQDSDLRLTGGDTELRFVHVQ